MSMADHSRKFWCAAARPDDCACRDSRERANSPGGACIAQARGWAWPLAVARCRGDGLVRVATEAPDFEIEAASVEGIAERGRRLRGTAIAEHALVAGVGGEGGRLVKVAQ